MKRGVGQEAAPGSLDPGRERGPPSRTDSVSESWAGSWSGIFPGGQRHHVLRGSASLDGRRLRRRSGTRAPGFSIRPRDGPRTPVRALQTASLRPFGRPPSVAGEILVGKLCRAWGIERTQGVLSSLPHDVPPARSNRGGSFFAEIYAPSGFHGPCYRGTLC